VIQSGSRIGPGSLTENSQLGEKCDCAVSGSDKQYRPVNPDWSWRPFAPAGVWIHAGNFVELKIPTLGSKTNVGHLSYLETPHSAIALISVPVTLPPTTTVKKHPGPEQAIAPKSGSNSVLQHLLNWERCQCGCWFCSYRRCTDVIAW